MQVLPSTPAHIKKWLATHPDPMSARSVGGYGVVSHVISQSCAREKPIAWRDRAAMERVSMLLQAGIRVDMPVAGPGPHPLFEACYRRLPRTVCLLMEHGANPLRTKPGAHDEMYILAQALQSFNGYGQGKTFFMVMDALLTTEVVDRINLEERTSIFPHELIDGLSWTVARQRLSFVIDKGVRVQEHWQDLLEDANVGMDWARRQQALHARSAMEDETPASITGARPRRI